MNVCKVSTKNEDKNKLWKLVLERGEFMLVQRVDHLAVQTLVYTPSTIICQLIYADLLLRKYLTLILILIFIANLTHF